MRRRGRGTHKLFCRRAPRRPQVYPSSCYSSLSVNALPLMCDKDSPSQSEEFVFRKVRNRRPRSQRRFFAREPPSSGRAAVLDSGGLIRWEVAQRELCKHVQFIFVFKKKGTTDKHKSTGNWNNKNFKFSLNAVLMVQLKMISIFALLIVQWMQHL